MGYTDDALIHRGEPQGFTVGRDGELDLVFSGWEIGHGTVGWGPSKRSPPEEWTHRTDVRVYLTAGGKWVGHIKRRGRRGPGEPTSEATVHDTPEEVFEWLTADGIGRATKEAWARAREALPAMPALDQERVD